MQKKLFGVLCWLLACSFGMEWIPLPFWNSVNWAVSIVLVLVAWELAFRSDHLAVLRGIGKGFKYLSKLRLQVVRKDDATA